MLIGIDWGDTKIKGMAMVADGRELLRLREATPRHDRGSGAEDGAEGIGRDWHSGFAAANEQVYAELEKLFAGRSAWHRSTSPISTPPTSSASR